MMDHPTHRTTKEVPITESQFKERRRALVHDEKKKLQAQRKRQRQARKVTRNG